MAIIAWVPSIYFNVQQYGADPTGVSDSASAIQAAISAANSAGGGTVYFPNGTYTLSTSIVPASNVTLLGAGISSVLTITANTSIISATTSSFSDFVVDNLTFVGTVNQFPSVPTRGRTTSGPGCVTAIYLNGSLNPYYASNGTMTNFTMRNCTVRNCSALPISIGGVGGTVRVTNNTFENNQDVGFLYDQEVIFSNNHVKMSADNGVSISRGCNKVTCTGNTFENCSYNGIWLSGYDIYGTGALNEIGPTNFTCTGNTIINVGYNGIIADAAPCYGTIADNTVNQGYFRGPSDQPGDGNGAGIYIGGYPLSNRAAPTAYAIGLAVSGNTLYQCARAGIYLTGGKAIDLDTNLILNCGTQYLADGTTAILASDTAQNIGIFIDYSTTDIDVIVRNNTVLDERTTPYCNWGIVPFTPVSSWVYFWNHMAGCRNAYNLLDWQNPTREITGTWRFDGNTKFVSGATSGSNTATGLVPGFDVNGAASSTRRYRLLTAGNNRWQFGANNTTESGSNVGSDFFIQAYDDAGNLLSTPVSITRKTGVTTFSAAVTPSGGVAPITTGFTSFGTGGSINLLNASSGASVTPVAGTLYWAALYIPFNVSLTGIIVSVGTTGGTDSWIGALYSASGTLIANSTLSGTLAGSANQKMKLPFTAPVTVTGPAVYYIALQSNGTTAKFLAFNNNTEGFVTGSTSGSFGTLPTITPGTTYTANVGPFACTY